MIYLSFFIFFFNKSNFLMCSFFVFCFLVLYFSFTCVTSKNIIEVLFGLVCVFLLSAGCLFCLKVEFLSIIFVMVYVGAIMVLFLFAIMLLNFRDKKIETGSSFFFYLSSVFLFILVYCMAFQYLNWLESLFFFELYASSVDFLYIIDFCLEDISIFKSLYGKYNILLILVAILLLIVMVGAISLCLSTKNLLLSVRRKKSL